MPYIKAGYTDINYFEGDIVPTNKKVNFVVDNQGLEEVALNKLLLDTYGKSYQDSINIIFGDELKIGQSETGEFSIKKMVGGINANEVISIVKNNFKIPSIPTVKDLVTEILKEGSLLSSLKSSILSSLNVNIVAKDGTLITSKLVYDDAKHKYILDYDTSLLDGTDYTIELSLD